MPAGLTHVDPLAPRGGAYRAWTRLTGSPLGRWLSPRTAWRIDPWLMRLTRGRFGMGLLLPTALLETRGARTGAPRVGAVVYFHDGDTPIVIASKLGEPRHPAWFHNARVNPDVRLGGEPFRAEVVEDGAERDRLWALADRLFPPFATYRDRAARAGRSIPILRLVPR